MVEDGDVRVGRSAVESRQCGFGKQGRGASTDGRSLRVQQRGYRCPGDRPDAPSGGRIRREPEEDETGEYVRRERRRTSIARSIPLPEAVGAGEISARYTNGVLTVRMPKSEPLTEGTEVEIQ